MTSPGVEATGQSLTRDGKKLAFSGNRAGKQDLWEKSLVDGREAPIVADDYNRLDPSGPAMDAPGIHSRQKGGSQLMMWSSQSRNEEPLTTSSQTYRAVWDWSPDGKWLLISQGNNDTHKAELWLLPVAARPHAETASRKITSNSAYASFRGSILSRRKMDCL